MILLTKINKICFPNHSWGKLRGLPNLPTSAIDNPFCLKMSQSGKNIICSHCYSIKTVIPNSPNNKRCRNAWKRNGNILSSMRIPFEDIPKVPRYRKNGELIPHPFIRCSNQGELINDFHYINIIQICRKNPDTTFILYTKRIDIIAKYWKKEYLKSHPLYNELNEVNNSY